MNNIIEKLNFLQLSVKANKDLFNKFGNYKYRSCESILEAVKPYLKEIGAVILLSDELVEIRGYVYVKAVAKLIDSENGEIATTAFAREAEQKKGMDVAQITGATSSYARKYALSGLLALDDNKDHDYLNEKPKPKPKPDPKNNEKPKSDPKSDPKYAKIEKALAEKGKDLDGFLQFCEINGIEGVENMEKFLKENGFNI